MELLYNFTAILAPFKWIIVGGSTLIGVGCFAIAWKARKKKRED